MHKNKLLGLWIIAIIIILATAISITAETEIVGGNSNGTYTITSADASSYGYFDLYDDSDYSAFWTCAGTCMEGNGIWGGMLNYTRADNDAIASIGNIFNFTTLKDSDNWSSVEIKRYHIAGVVSDYNDRQTWTGGTTTFTGSPHVTAGVMEHDGTGSGLMAFNTIGSNYTMRMQVNTNGTEVFEVYANQTYIGVHSDDGGSAGWGSDKAMTIGANGNTNSLLYYITWTGQLEDAPYLTPPAPPASTYLNISDSTPADNALVYNNVNFNMTVNSSNNWNATLYINGTLNETKQYTNADNTVGFQKTLPLTNNTYYINIVNNWSNQNTSTKTINVWENFTITHNQTVTTSYVGLNLTLNCTYTNPNDYELTEIWYVNNTNDNTLWNQTNQTYEFKNTDLFDNLTTWCEVNSSVQTTTSNTDHSRQQINMIYTITSVNYLSQALSSVLLEMLEVNVNYTNNPINILATDIINSSNKSVDRLMQVTDLLAYNRIENFTETFNETNQNITLELDPNQLRLTFYQDEVLTSTKGYIIDEEKGWNWSNSTLIVIQDNLTEGYVKIKFGGNTQTNETQYYEYINDYTTHIIEDLEINQQNNWYTYIQVLDLTTSPIEDATVQMYTVDPYLNYPNVTYMKLIGQRLTDDEGYTFFWGDTNTEARVRITKTGYEPYEMIINIGEESFTRTDALEIYLQQSRSSIAENAWLYIRNTFTNRSADITGTILAIDATKVEVTTDFRTAQSLEPYDITALDDARERYTFTLRSGIDFEETGTADIPLHIYIDDELTVTVTIEYDDATKDEIFNITGLNATILDPMIFIMLILASAGIGIMMQGDNAPTIFKFGAIFITFFASNFIWLATVIIISWMLKHGIRRLISE